MSPHRAPEDRLRGPVPHVAVVVVLLAALGMIGPFSIDTPFPAFAQMRGDLGVTSAALQQVVSAYMLAFAAMSLFHGPLSDAVGRKPVIVAGLSVYVLASIGCALSPTLPALLAFRVLQGMSAGAATIVSRTIVRDLFEGPQAQRLMSIIGMIFGIGTALAPVLGGWLLLLGSWHLIFWFLCLFGAALALVTVLVLPESHPPSDRTPLRVGAILRGVATVGRERDFQVLTGATAFSFAAQFLWIAAAPLIVVDLLGQGERDFWKLFVPMVGAMVLGSLANTLLAGRVEGHRLISGGQMVSLVGAVVGVVLAMLPATDAVLPWAVVGLVGVAFGTGISLPVYQLTLLDAFPRARGSAASVSTFAMLILNASLAGLVAPVVTGSMLTVSLTSLGLLLVGIALWWLYRYRTGHRPTQAAPASPVVTHPETT